MAFCANVMCRAWWCQRPCTFIQFEWHHWQIDSISSVFGLQNHPVSQIYVGISFAPYILAAKIFSSRAHAMRNVWWDSFGCIFSDIRHKTSMTGQSALCSKDKRKQQKPLFAVRDFGAFDWWWIFFSRHFQLKNAMALALYVYMRSIENMCKATADYRMTNGKYKKWHFAEWEREKATTLACEN